MAARCLFQLFLLGAMGLMFGKCEDNKDIMYKCLINQGCDCGEEGRLRINNCWEKLLDSSRSWYLGELNKCENLNATFDKSEMIPDWVPTYCALEETDRRNCFDYMYDELVFGSNPSQDYITEELVEADTAHMNCMFLIFDFCEGKQEDDLQCPK